MNQADTEGLASGATLVAGYYSTPLNKGGEYEVQTTVAEGNLEIGCDVRNTDANWVAVDNFRLYYAGDDNADYSDYRTHAVSEVREAIADVEHPVAAYTQALDNAMSAAENAEGNEAIVSALADMRTAHAEFVESMQAYNKLAGIISTSETFIAGSDYPNKDEYRRAIDAARSVLDGDNTEISAWQQAYDDLKAASQAYLAGRPSEWHEIANGSIWKDTEGNIVQAHAPGFIQVNDTWYMIGEDRTNQWNPDVNMYSSKDLVHWKFERKIIENRVTHPQLGVDRMIERPKLMYCEKTGKYVVWCHWEAGNYGASEAAVFVADQVNGEYRYHWSGRPLGVKSRDCNVFVDTDGTAYFISTIEENQHLGLFKLSDDYLSAVEYTELFKWKSREAPVIVKVNGVYHMLSSACSGWDPNQCQLAYSRSLTSGWSDLKNVGNKISYDTQAAAVLTVAGKEGTSYIYVGDRWQDPALAESKTIMFPISFTDTSCKFGYSKNFEVNFALGQVREGGADERVLDKTGWRVVDFSSEETSGENGRAVNVIDGDLSTKWHTRYSGTRAQAPHFVTVDMGESHTVAGFLCVPRTDNDVNGLVREYVFQTSEDGENWTTVSSSSWLPYWTEVYFPAVSARYFKLTATKGDYASISEIDILTEKDETEDLVFQPYSKIGEDDWTMNGDITVPVGSKVALGPQIDGSRYGYGSWSLVKPDGSVNPGREHTLENLQTAHSGRYSYLYLDPSQHTHTFGYNVLVSDSPTSVNGPVSDSKIVVDRRYYTVDGIETAPPASCGVVVVKTVYSDGTVEFSKMMAR